LKYRRGTAEEEVLVHPLTACAYGVTVLDSEDINAAADGKRIAIDRGLIRFVKTDDELALVMAHELAHDTERHIRAKSANAAMGTVGGAAVDVLLALGGVNTGGAFAKAGRAAGAGYASAAFESEADYIGMYYMARAGYDVNGVEDFWRRMAVENPHAIFVTTDHPSSPARYVAIAKTRDEILAKRKAGAPLLPERRAGRKVEIAAAGAP
jgi:predicted Zn-dependent protease